MVNLLVAAALAAATPSGMTSADLPVERPAEPAMFVVRDADTTVYIFGTFHALDGHSHWFSEQVRQAFERSNELVLETLIPEEPQPDRPGRSRVPPAFRDTVRFLPGDDADGDQRRPLAGNAGRQWRRHGAPSSGRNRRQAGRGPRNAPITDRHVQSHARSAHAGNCACAVARTAGFGRRKPDAEPVGGNGARCKPRGSAGIRRYSCRCSAS